MVLVIHWHELAMDLHVFPILIPPPTSLSTWSLWVFPVHQPRALVSCIQPRLVICFTLDNIPCPCTLGAARVPKSQAAAPSSCSTLTGSGLPQAKNVLHLCTQGCFGRVWLFVTMWTMVCQSSLSVGFFRQEYWSVLANTGLHTLLEHHISCCPSCQLSCVPDAVRTPAIQAAARPPYLALTGANPSLPGQPQEQTPVGNPHAEVEIKPQLKPRGRVAEEEGPKPSHQLHKLKVKSNQLADSVSVEYINSHWELPQKKMH